MKTVCFLLSFLTAQLACAQLTPEAAASLMGRGINMGNTLEPPYEAAWNNPVAEEYYFDDYVEAGFQTVRLPVRWDN
ncbi:MAG: aryl-phospho-beta-D-glucosidase BglC (GH1 family), partial [Rhodothermales bacterium]